MIRREGDVLRVAGDLTMDSLGALHAEAMMPLQGKDWKVDLAELGTADSSAVSLLLGWKRNAQRHGASVEFLNVPDNLVSLARLYGVAEALQLEQPTR